MKKYKKKPSQLFQIRLSKEENKEAKEFFKEIQETRRTWLMDKIRKARKSLLVN